MTRHTESLSAEYFEGRYREDIDPWDFRSSAYEREKYDATLIALGKPTYKHVLEVGCSIGVFTTKLAKRSERLMAIDASQTAIDAARKNNTSNVTFEKGVLPGDFPEGPFDLIVLSEVLYYFNEADLRVVADLCCAALAPGGEMALCHWLGETDYPLTGHQASDIFAEAVVKRAPSRRILRDEVYRLEIFSP